MLFAANAAEHVMDGFHWVFFETLGLEFTIPHLGGVFHGDGFGLTKYTFLMFLAAGIILWIYLPLSARIRTGEAPTGAFWNLFEGVLTFIRDEIAKPYIGEDADKYVSYLWTVFLFVLTCNLLGMVPFLGSPTASYATTFVLACGTYILINVASILRFGIGPHLASFAPHMDMPMALKVGIWALLWPIEFLGLIIKCFVLSVRLFANMFAGHMVLATILLFIPAMRNSGPALEWGVTFASVVGVIGLSMLELFVAFLQAYLFTFLTALFLGGVLEHAGHYAHAGHDHGHDQGHGHADDSGAGAEDVHVHDKSHGHGH